MISFETVAAVFVVTMGKKLCTFEKGNFSVIIPTVATRKESFVKNLNLIDSNYHCKNWIDWISGGSDKISQPQKCKLLDKVHER